MKGSLFLQSQISKWAVSKPTLPSIRETNSDAILTYQELAEQIYILRNYLGPQAKTIMVALSGGILDSLLWLSALTGGHLFIPVSPTLTEFEYLQYMTKHKPDIIITLDEQKNLKIKTTILTQTGIKKIITENKQTTNRFLLPKAREGKIFLSTSGSTGKPKGIVLTATQIVTTADYIRKTHKITKDDRGLTPLPFYHINAPVVSLITSILAGSELIIAPKYSTTNFWTWVKKYDPTWISLVPTMIAMLLTTERPDFLKKSSLRFIRTASAPLPKINLEKFEKKFGIPLIETYGITEAASTIVANPVPPKKHKPGSVGLPIGVAVRICKPDEGKELHTNSIGEICIKGPTVISSYEGNAAAASFSNGWFRTGDLGYIDSDGYIFITGRIKDIIIRGGENIIPREIEEVLLTYPDVQEVAVVGQPDPIYGEQVIAFIVLHTKQTKDVVEKIQEYARKKLSPQKVPAKLYILPQLPRTHAGKIDKPALRILYTKA